MSCWSSIELITEESLVGAVAGRAGAIFCSSTGLDLVEVEAEEPGVVPVGFGLVLGPLSWIRVSWRVVIAARLRSTRRDVCGVSWSAGAVRGREPSGRAGS